MRQLQPFLARWRGIVALGFMAYIYHRTSGPFAWLLGAAAATVLYSALTRFFPVRAAPSAVDATSHGSARFATNHDLKAAGNLAPALATTQYVLGLPLERDRRDGFPAITTRTKFAGDGERPDDGHLVTIAPAGSGKGVAVVQPNLRCYEGPVVVLDPKGENYLHTAPARARLGHDIRLIDPFGVIPEAQRAPHLARLNPLDALQDYYASGDHSAVVDEAAAIAEMVIVTEGSERDPHWNDKAGAFLKAALMFVTYGKGYQDRQKTPLALSTVKDVIYSYFSSDEGIQKFITRCQDSPYLHAAAGQVAMIAPTERSSVLSTLLRHTEFLDSPSVRQCVGETDFNLADLKTRKLSIYLVLPANNLKTYNRLARLWVGSLLRAMMRDSLTMPRWRVLFLLDEVGQLERMDSLEQAMSLGRGYGIDMWLIFQNLDQLKRIYGEAWESPLANARVTQFFGVQDVTTAEYVSKKLGQATIRTVSQNHSTATNTGRNSGSSYTQGGTRSGSSGTSWGDSRTAGASTQQTGRALLQPDEVARLPADQLLIFLGAQYPVLARKCSVLDPAIGRALDEVRPVDPPALEDMRTSQAAARAMPPSSVQEGEQRAAGAPGAAQIGQLYTLATGREQAHGRAL